MKKRWMIIVAIIIAVLLLFPVPIHMKDGGSVRYQAILYSVTDYRAIRSPGEYATGVEVKILGITVYDNNTAPPLTEGTPVS